MGIFKKIKDKYKEDKEERAKRKRIYKEAYTKEKKMYNEEYAEQNVRVIRERARRDARRRPGDRVKSLAKGLGRVGQKLGDAGQNMGEANLLGPGSKRKRHKKKRNTGFM